MKKPFLLFLFCLLAITNLSAQYYTNQNKVWAFGKNAGLDFNSGIPVPISTSIDQIEGCASVSSTTGSLLFYTDGKKVYNRIGALMPAGSSIVPFGTNSTKQAALIIPVISNPNQYYIFSMECWESGGGRLAYGIVDMTLAGGLGDIVTTSMGIPVEDSLDETMIAITGNNNNIWLITHKRDTSLFLAYNITSAGISSIPIVSTISSFNGSHCFIWSILKASPDRRKIVQAVEEFDQCYGTTLFDFNPDSGTISNPLFIDTSQRVSGVEFSPDNSKLYLAEYSKRIIIQFDITVPTLFAIQSHKSIVMDSVSVATDMKLGPDGKIYFKNTSPYMDSAGAYLDCISLPNLNSASCNYIYRAVTLLAGTKVTFMLPNLFVTTDTVDRSAIDDVISLQTITLSPNPATTELTITAPEKITHLAIHNMVGQEVYHHTCNSEAVKVDISNLPTGVYFVKVNNALVQKFVKQ